MSKFSHQRRYANLSDEKLEEELNKINPNVKVTSFEILLFCNITTPHQSSKAVNIFTRQKVLKVVKG